MPSVPARPARPFLGRFLPVWTVHTGSMDLYALLYIVYGSVLTVLKALSWEEYL